MMKKTQKETCSEPQKTNKCIICGAPGSIQFKGRTLCRGCLEYVKENCK